MDYLVLGLLVVIAVLVLILLFKISKNEQTDFRPFVDETQAKTKQVLQESQQNLLAHLNNQEIRLSNAVNENAESQRQEIKRQSDEMNQKVDAIKAGNSEGLKELNSVVTEKMQTTLNERLQKQSETVSKSVTDLGKILLEQQKTQSIQAADRLERLENSFKSIQKDLNQGMIDLKKSNSEELEKIRKENQEKLDQINGTVQVKLQKTLDDKISQSFDTVSKQLKAVYEGLGEMKDVASGVKDLKNVLANVKNRGTLGEIQLGMILEDILSPGQYGSQIQISPDKNVLVDYAVILPGNDEKGIYLPIDSKFPGDTYTALMDAYDSGDPGLVKQKQEALKKELQRAAKSIKDKYIEPPYTTNFAIMFLPFEGLYSEAVRLGMVETLQRECQVNITGPSTMAAMLNSLQMGFQTLAIQKKSNEVWEILGAAKKEFQNFEDVLQSTRKRLKQADNELDKLIGTRTRAINRSLKGVSNLSSSSDTSKLLGLDDPENE